jgi:hypothetical protein
MAALCAWEAQVQAIAVWSLLPARGEKVAPFDRLRRRMRGGLKPAHFFPICATVAISTSASGFTSPHCTQ